MNKAIEQYLEKHGFEALCPRAVIFDMDGVLYDSMPNHAIAWHDSMDRFGIHMTELDAYATEGARGVDTIRQMVKAQQGRDIDEAEAQRMYDVKSELFHALPKPSIMPGVLDLMGQIRDLGLQIGVVTGSGQRPLIQRLLSDFGDFVNTDPLVTAYDVKRGKPQPDPYLMGLQKMGDIMSWEALVVENAPLGVQAGAAARIFTIAVNTGILPDSQLWESGANLVFPNMMSLGKALPSIVHS